VLMALAPATLLATATASACPCTEFCGPVVAHGNSLFAVPWRIRAIPPSPGAEGMPTATIGFSIGPCGKEDGDGYFVGLPLPIPHAFVFSADTGTEIDSHPEGDLSGVTARRAVKLVVTMSGGSTLTVRPRLAPRRLWKRLTWLRRLRFFDEFFPALTAAEKPLIVTAYDRTGAVLARRKSDLGSFS
jgi:hypothetical protein